MRQKKLANSYLSSFCMELSMLLQAGITLSDGVAMLLDDEHDAQGKEVIRSFLEPLADGKPLSEALRGSGYFPEYVLGMVETGEKTGRLTQTLKALADHYGRQERLAAAVKSAVLYPLIMLVMMVAVVLVLIIRVLPIFEDVFNRLGSSMSPLAIRLMQFGSFLQGASAVIAAVFGALLVFLLVFFAVPSVRQSISRAFKDRMGDKGLLGGIASSRFTSVMTLAIASGIDTEEAVRMAIAISGGSKALDEKYQRCLEMLKSGSTLSEAMFKNGLLSARNSRLLSLGARSGMTEDAMADIAARSDQSVQDQIERMVGRVEPTLVITTSVIVGVILLSVMVPLASIMSTLG